MSRGLKAPFKPYEGRKTKDKHIRWIVKYSEV